MRKCCLALPETRVLKIGIVGTAHAADYVSSVRSIPGCQLIGFSSADASSSALRTLARSSGARFFNNVQKMLDMVDCIVLTSGKNHLRLIELAASAGVHILCEMPLASDVEKAKRIIDACQKFNVRLMPALPLRFSTVLEKAKQAISAGEVGKIVSVVSKYHAVQTKSRSAGVVFQEGIDIFDALCWILQSEITEVYAQAPGDSGQFAVISLLTHSGVIASVRLWGLPPNNGFLSDRHLWIKFVGTGGTVEVDAFGQTVTVCGKEALRRIEWGDNVHRRMVESFVRSIERGNDFEVSVGDGLIATEVAVIASRAVSKGAPVTVS